MPFKKAKSEKKAHYYEHTSKDAFLIPSEDLKVVKDLGEGQYGVVQLAEWKPQHEDLKYVAIKSILNTPIDGVLQEAHTMQKLSHENIVKFYGISLPSGDKQLRLVTEFAPYGSLDKNFKNKNKNVLKVSTLCKFASQVAQGMHYLASQQLVHRDLATRNILLFEQDLVKISDFGLARWLEKDAVQEISLPTMLAVAWMPPEVIAKRVFTSASDVWSFGITLWEMFSFGQQPWADFSSKQIKQMVASDSSKHLAKPHACPDGFYELIMLKSWANDPKDRPTFEYLVNNVMPQLQPQEVTTKVPNKTYMQGYLSYGSKEKFTFISRVGDGMLLVQSESGSIGLIDEKHVEFPKKKIEATQITCPFQVKKRESSELLAELQKIAGEEKVKKEMDDLRKQREEKQPVNHLLDLDEDDVAIDPNYMLYPDPYPAMPGWSNSGSAGPDPNVYLAMAGGEGPGEGSLDEEDYMSMDYAYSSLKIVEGQENFTRPPGQFQPTKRPGRTMSESEILMSDQDYQVPFQNMKGSKDDSSVQLGSKGTPGDKTLTPVVPARLDLIRENSMTLPRNALNDRHAGLSPHATTPRKRPVPAPRRKKMEYPRPVSDSFVDVNDKSDLEESRRRSNTESATDDGADIVACKVGQRNAPPKIPFPYESTRILNDSERGKRDASQESNQHMAVEITDDKEPEQDVGDVTASVASPGSLTASVAHPVVTASVAPHGDVTASVAQHPDVTASVAPHGDVTASVAQHGDLTTSDANHGAGSGASQSLVNSSVMEDLIDFSSECADLPPLPPKQHAAHAQKKPVYAKPLSLAMYPDIPEEVINQPPPPPNELFGGTALRPNVQSNDVSDLAYSTVPLFDARGGLVSSYQPPVGDLAFSPLNKKPLSSTTAKPADSAVKPIYEHIWPDVDPVNPGSSFVNPNFDFHNPEYNPDISTTNLPNPTIHPSFKLVNQDLKPVNVAVQPAHPDAKPAKLGYGDEIDAGIQKIQEVCGMDVSRDWCYAALLQYQGDVEHVVHILKAQTLVKITGKTEQFCTRTLSHCNWDLNRAAVYIIENYEDKNV